MDKMRDRIALESYMTLHAQSADMSDSGSSASSTGSVTNKKWFIALVGLFIIMLVICVILLVLQLTVLRNRQFCNTPECVTLSGEILKYMDLSVDPCEDFYEYTCHKWSNNQLIPSYIAKWSRFSEVIQNLHNRVSTLLSQPGYDYIGKNSTAIEKAKKYYRICMNEEKNKDLGIEPMLKMIENLGGWPLLSNVDVWNKKSLALTDLIVNAHRLVGKGLWGFGVAPDEYDNSINIINVEQVTLTFKDYTNYVGTNNERFKETYLKFVMSVSELLGAKNDKLRDDAEDLWNFEKQLAEALDKPEDLIDVRKYVSIITIEQLREIMLNKVDMLTYFETLYNKSLLKTHYISVSSPHYFAKLANLLKQTSSRIVTNYIVWSNVHHMLNYIPEMDETILQVKKSSEGTNILPSRLERCMSKMNAVFGFALAALYVDKHFAENDRHRASEMVEYIRNALEQRLNKNDWMDEATKARALKKLKSMATHIGYPDFVKDPVLLDEYYKKLEVVEVFFLSGLNAHAFLLSKEADDIGEPVDSSRWTHSPITANAYYSLNKNAIIIPAGILLPPFYDPSYSMPLVFGSLGGIIGHELTHGFDNKGRLFDETGNLANWWSNMSAIKFDHETKCLINQYNNFKVGNSFINGATTLSENIADSGGINVAYDAYTLWREKNSYQDQVLPGLNMTDDQLLFVSWTRIWCSYYTPKYAQQSLVTDKHPYSKYRPIGSLSNMPQFAVAYQCSPDARMNPKNRCGIW